MKKTIKVAALMLVLVMTVFVFASCATKLSGEYKDALTGNISYEFKGNKYTKTIDNLFGDDTVIEGTYKIDTDEGTITFTYEVDGEEKVQTSSFSQGEEDGVEYIKIDGLKYNKK